MAEADTRGTGPGTSATPPEEEHWFLDLDGCLVDSLTGTSVRPGARELLEHLAGSGRHVLLWSAVGADHARERAEQFGVDGHVRKYFSKHGRDGLGCYRTEHLPGGDQRVFVDDRPEDLRSSHEVVAVSPYLSEDPHDRGLDVVARRAGRSTAPTGRARAERVV